MKRAVPRGYLAFVVSVALALCTSCLTESTDSAGSDSTSSDSETIVEVTEDSIDVSSPEKGEGMCIWDTCVEDSQCPEQQKCYLHKEYDWGHCFLGEEPSCLADEDCEQGVGQICVPKMAPFVDFYEGLPEYYCVDGCRDDFDCRNIPGMRCVSTVWDQENKFCAPGCVDDSDCDTEEDPLLRCLPDNSKGYSACREHCTSDEECVASKGDGYRCGAHNFCLTGTGCVDNSECASTEYCDSRAGCFSCVADGECRGSPHTDGKFCEEGRCVYCTGDEHCSGEYPACRDGICARCTEDKHCDDFHRCNNERCEFVGCSTDQDCRDIQGEDLDELMGDYMVCLLVEENGNEIGNCIIACVSDQMCRDFKAELPDSMGGGMPNWSELSGACMPPCSGDDCSPVPRWERGGPGNGPGGGGSDSGPDHGPDH